MTTQVIHPFFTMKTKTETEQTKTEQTKTEQTLTISFTLPLVSLAEATKTSPEWLIEHQEILSDYMRGYWVFENELDNSHIDMLTQAVEEVKGVSDEDEEDDAELVRFKNDKALRMMAEREAGKCCGCDKVVHDEDDYGNNADVSDTCCKECWEKHIQEEDD